MEAIQMDDAVEYQPITYREYQFSSEFPIILMQSNVISMDAALLHYHNCLEIVYCEKGKMIWNLENKIYRVQEGSICMIPPYETHSSMFDPEQEGEVLCHFLFLNPEELLKSFYPSGLPKEFHWYLYNDFEKVLDGSETETEQKMLGWIIREIIEQKPYYEMTVRGMTETLLVQLYRHNESKTWKQLEKSSVPMLYAALEWLNREYQQKIDVEELAQRCGMSRTRFLQKFQECFHQTPLQYQKAVRINEACRLLTSTEMSILNIMEETGFSSLTSFIRNFEKIMQRSPQEFRKEHKVISKKKSKYKPYQDGIDSNIWRIHHE